MDASVRVESRPQEPLMFHLSGRRFSTGLDGISGLRPALVAPYRDLTQLRYDFPVVLVAPGTETMPVRSLSEIIDGLLQRIAPPGIESERLRRLVLRLEREIRTLAAHGVAGPLSELWDLAADRLEASDENFAKSVRIARAALDTDGEVLDCDAAMAGRLIAHLWASVEADRARTFWATAGRLMIKLADILRVDAMRSAAGRGADSLKAGFAPAHQNLFDFAAMSRVLPKATAREALPEARRARIEQALSVLKIQKFFAPPAGQTRPAGSPEPHGFAFTSCAAAIAAYEARLPEMVELVKALAIAELEIDGRYDETDHDEFFAGFDAGALGDDDFALFPDYLVTLGGLDPDVEHAGLLEALSSGVPLKIVADIRELVRHAPGGDGLPTFGSPGARLAAMAVGLDGVFVLQSASSNLYAARDRVRRGLAGRAPALFAVFSGRASGEGGLSAYLSAAAAMQSRAFPAFTFDPAAGADIASRFSIDDNPQPDADWTAHRFAYADEDLQRVAQQIAFTFVDFLASDPGHGRHFARVGRGQWSDRMVPVAEWLADPRAASDGRVPFIWMVDADDRLARVVVDDKAMLVARRCLDAWHRLQELGGVHNSHAERLLAREKAAWAAERQRERDGGTAAPGTAPVAAAPAAVATPAAAAQPAEAAEPERSADDPYIETARCSSCNECIHINDRMFVYDANKQAYIADPDAGTFAQLVEAAESCQIGIIHPGKPRNPAEPGLDDLIKRAEPFR